MARPCISGFPTLCLANHMHYGLENMSHPQNESPQDCVLIPLLYSLDIYYYVAISNSTIFVKFADNTAVMGLVFANFEKD